VKKHKKIQGLSIILLTCLLGISPAVDAQEYIDEDFLDKIEENAKFMLNEPAPAFKVSATPAKWDKESAVVIGYSRSIQFDRTSRGGFISRKERSLWFMEKDRLKIKLNDNNSVKSFSEIYFRYGAKEDGFIARIIKPDGTTSNIDLKTAVGVENNSSVPEYFQSFFDKVANSQYTYYKVPVPGLEPGDILEYVMNTKSKLDVTSSGYIEFSPVYEVCAKNYPLLYNEIAIETDDKSFFKYLSLNGAPKFTKENSADKDFFRYVFVDKDRDTEKDVHFVSPFLHYPMVKFQVIYSNRDDVKGALIGDKGELKSEFTREQLARKAWEDYEKMGSQIYERSQSAYGGIYNITVQTAVNQWWSELVKLGAKNWTEQQYTERVYYFLRNKIVFRDSYWSDKLFAFMFGSLLYQRDIKSELVISMGNNIGKLKEVLFDDEIRYVIKMGDKLYFNVTDYSNPGDIVENLLDNEAYIIYEPAKKGGGQEIKPFTLPGTTAADNTTDVVFKTEIAQDMKTLMVIRTSTHTGFQKSKNSADALKFTTYIFDDYKNYGGNSPTDKMTSREAENYNTTIKEATEDFKKQKSEMVKKSLESEYGETVRNIHFDVVSDGRTLKNNKLVIKEGFELSNFVRKAGKKYMVNLAGLVGSQLQVKKEERTRTHDIDVRFSRSYTWTINFKIPDGYTVQGLNEVSKSVDNVAGSFSIAAKEENGIVVFNIAKTYKQKNIPKDQWQSMLVFIDAAYNSSFKYILLVPKQ
jgi:hypothetical protein